jgi:hypothetical protein
VDTDCVHTDIRLPEEMLSETIFGKLKFEGDYDVSYYLGKKQYYLKNRETGDIKVAKKGYDNDLEEKDWIKAKNGGVVITDYFWFKKKNHVELFKVDGKKKFRSYFERIELVLYWKTVLC